MGQTIVKTLIEQSGVDVADIAAKCEVSEDLLYRWMIGTRSPRTKHLYPLASSLAPALGRTVADVLVDLTTPAPAEVADA